MDAKHDHFPHIGRLYVNILNVPGTIGAIITSIAMMGAEITDLKRLNRFSDFHEILIDIEVRDVEHLKTLIAYLRSTKTVHSIERG